jgi:predicted secreted protein with PEFG-CTERM motif
MKFYLFIILSILIGSFAFVNAYADAITFSTNKQLVTEPFEKFLIEGKVAAKVPLRQVVISIYDPNGKLVYSPTVTLTTQNEFVNVARADSSWKVNGIYTIEVSNQKIGITSVGEIEVQVEGNTAASAPSFSKREVSGLTIEHSKGVGFLNVQVDEASKKITFNISTLNTNQLTLKLPQKLISGPNTIIVDGNQISNFQITKTSTGNTITIPLKSNSQQIEIIGTSVIPEFGSITIIILAVAITSVVLVMRKSFKISPTFLNQ